MPEPDFLSWEDILDIHRDQLGRYGGMAGIRDVGLLESAITMPQTTFDGIYVHTDLFEMAAAYLYHIGMNHPFLDGNKRTATVASLVFLSLNGYKIQVENESLTTTVLSVVTGKMSKRELASYLRENARRSDN